MTNKKTEQNNNNELESKDSSKSSAAPTDPTEFIQGDKPVKSDKSDKLDESTDNSKSIGPSDIKELTESSETSKTGKTKEAAESPKTSKTGKTKEASESPKTTKTEKTKEPEPAEATKSIDESKETAKSTETKDTTESDAVTEPTDSAKASKKAVESSETEEMEATESEQQTHYNILSGDEAAELLARQVMDWITIISNVLKVRQEKLKEGVAETEVQSIQTVQRLLEDFQKVIGDIIQSVDSDKEVDIVDALKKLKDGIAKSDPDSSVLSRVTNLYNRFNKDYANHQMKEELEQRYADIRNFEPGEDEKFVYVRLFHNQFEKLPMFNQLYDISWLKNILESLANTEAHGYAIFENEEDVEASIKAKNKPHLYCHARLLIKKDQDISNDRPHKIDELINIPLVTLAPLEMKSLQHILLSYGGSQYYIFMQNGRINVQLLTVEEDETDDDFE